MNGLTGRWRMLALTGGLAATLLSSMAGAWPAPPPIAPSPAAPGPAEVDLVAPPFAQLLRQAMASPRIAALEADVDRAAGLARQAGTRPNPSVSLYAENFAGASPYRDFDRTEATLQIDQPIELGGKRSARIAAGAAGVEVAQLRSLEGRLTFAWDLARVYAGAEIAERRVAIAEDAVEEASADLKMAQALVTAGKEARLRQLQAETELSTLRSELETAKANRTAAMARLAALAGVAVPFTGLAESLLDRLAARPASGPIDPMQAITVRAADAERAAAARRVTVQRKAAIPDVTAQLGVRRLEIDNATAIVAGLSVPLNIFDRNRGNIAAAQAEARGAEARAAAARLEAQAEANAALAMVEAADARAAAADRTMATANEAYRLARIAYEAGKAPLIELLAARHGLGVARGVVLDAAGARLDARASLARLQGLTITGEPVQ